MTALSELLDSSNTNRWSTREIARRAQKSGHKLSQPTVSVYIGGRHGMPSEEVLAAFSDVLNIPIDKLRRAAGVPAGAGTPWAPPVEANRLDVRQRRALEELIRSMVASESTGEDQDDGRDDQQDGERSASTAGGSGVEDPAVRHGVTPLRGRREAAVADDDDREVPWAAARGTSRREGMDTAAARRGEESQDPGTDEPA